MQTMQHTPQQINEIIQSQIQQQQMQEKAKQRAAAASSSHGGSVTQPSQSPITTLNLVNNEAAPQSQVINQMPTQKVVTQQILSGGNQVPMNSNQPNIQQQQQQQQMTANQAQINPMTQNNQMNMQRQLSLQQMEANARNQKIQMISQQLQQSTQNQQQLIAQQQFKQYQSNQNQMMGNASQAGIVSQIGQNMPQQQQQFAPVNQQANMQQQQQNQPQSVQHPQQFPGQQMKQIISPNQTQNQQFMINQNAPGGAVKTIAPQTAGNNSGNNYIQIIQQGQQIIQIQHPEGGQMQQKVLNQTIHVSYLKLKSPHSLLCLFISSKLHDGERSEELFDYNSIFRLYSKISQRVLNFTMWSPTSRINRLKGSKSIRRPLNSSSSSILTS